MNPEPKYGIKYISAADKIIPKNPDSAPSLRKRSNRAAEENGKIKIPNKGVTIPDKKNKNANPERANIYPAFCISIKTISRIASLNFIFKRDFILTGNYKLANGSMAIFLARFIAVVSNLWCFMHTPVNLEDSILPFRET